MLQSPDGCDSREGKQRQLHPNSLWATMCMWQQDIFPHVTPQGSNSPTHTFSCLSGSESCSPQHKAPPRAPSLYQASCSLCRGVKDTSRDLNTWAAHGLIENWPFPGNLMQSHNIKDNSHDKDPPSRPRSYTQRHKKHPATAAGTAPGLAPDGQ